MGEEPNLCTNPAHVEGHKCFYVSAFTCNPWCDCCMIGTEEKKIVVKKTKSCTHPNHVDGQSCLTYAIGCAMLCECCMGEALVANVKTWAEEEQPSVPYPVMKMHELGVLERNLNSNWVVPDWE